MSTTQVVIVPFLDDAMSLTERKTCTNMRTRLGLDG